MPARLQHAASCQLCDTAERRRAPLGPSHKPAPTLCVLCGAHTGPPIRGPSSGARQVRILRYVMPSGNKWWYFTGNNPNSSTGDFYRVLRSPHEVTARCAHSRVAWGFRGAPLGGYLGVLGCSATLGRCAAGPAGSLSRWTVCSHDDEPPLSGWTCERQTCPIGVAPAPVLTRRTQPPGGRSGGEHGDARSMPRWILRAESAVVA
jgi:hypothetical protein